MFKTLEDYKSSQEQGSTQEFDKTWNSFYPEQQDLENCGSVFAPVRSLEVLFPGNRRLAGVWIGSIWPSEAGPTAFGWKDTCWQTHLDERDMNWAKRSFIWANVTTYGERIVWGRDVCFGLTAVVVGVWWSQSGVPWTGRWWTASPIRADP